MSQIFLPSDDLYVKNSECFPASWKQNSRYFSFQVSVCWISWSSTLPEKHYHRPANPFTLDISGYALSKTLALCWFFKRSSFFLIKRSTFTFVVNRIFLLSEVVRNFLTFISWNPNFHREARCGYPFFTKITLRFLQRGSFFAHPGLLIIKNLKGLG